MILILLSLVSFAPAADPSPADAADLKQLMQQYETLKTTAPETEYDKLQDQIHRYQAEIATLQAEKELLTKEIGKLRAACPGK